MPGARRIEYLPLSSLQGAKSNPKGHDSENIQASVSRFGFVDPPTLDERTGRLVGGHGRRDALLALKAAGSAAPAGIRVERDDWYVPVLRGWASEDDASADAFLLASNQLTMAGGWDEAELAKMLADLSKVPESMAGVGFTERELVSFLASLGRNEGQCDPDDVPEEPEEKDVYVKAGELWLLGKHRLLCGDSTKAKDVERLMAGERAAACLTDPPYGSDEPERLQSIISGSVNNLPIDNGVIVAFASPRTFPTWLDVIRAAGQKFERMLWLYKQAQMAHPWRGWLLKSEAILVSTVGDGEWSDVHPYSHDCYMLPEVSGEIPDGLGWHGSVKPISVVSDIAARVGGTGSVVYEPFSGSGTTILACEKIGRQCRAIELAPVYVQVAIERWQKFTGEKAVCEGAPRVRRARSPAAAKPAKPEPVMALLPAVSDRRTPDAPPSASDVDTDAIPF